jgi:hypothetical protein
MDNNHPNLEQPGPPVVPTVTTSSSPHHYVREEMFNQVQGQLDAAKTALKELSRSSKKLVEMHKNCDALSAGQGFPVAFAPDASVNNAYELALKAAEKVTKGKT